MKPHVLLLALSAPLAAQVAGTWNLDRHPDLPSLVAQATAGMEPAPRARARAALLDHNPIHQRIAIAHEGGHVILQFDQSAPQRLRDDGLAVPWAGADGRKYLVSARLEGPDLVQTLMGEDGMRRVVFHAGRGILTLKVTVKAMLLPRPLRYTLVYRS